MDGGNQYTTDWGYAWLHGHVELSLCVWPWAVAKSERRPLSVTHSAKAAAGMWLAASLDLDRYFCQVILVHQPLKVTVY